MANTTNLDLVKPLGTDRALVAVINSNMDKIDAYAGKTDDAIGGLADGLAIIANGDTHAAIASGQYVYVRGHGTLTDGLYIATANIAENGTLSGSNLTADSSGGLNTVYDTLNDKFANYALKSDVAKVGRIVVIGDVTFTNGTGSKTVEGVSTSARLVPSRRQGAASSVILTAICSTAGTVTFGAYDTSGSGGNFTGTLSGIILLIDDR